MAPQNKRKNSVVPNASKGQFKPGQSGNPGGRPKTARFAEELREWLRGRDGKGRERLQIALENLLRDDPKILLHYAFGKPVEHVEHSGGIVAGLPDDYLQLLRDHARKL